MYTRSNCEDTFSPPGINKIFWLINWLTWMGVIGTLSVVQLLDFCASQSFSITNNMFNHKSVHKCTWHEDTLGWWSMMEFIVISSDLWPYVLDTWVIRGAELLPDHHLALSWIKWWGRIPDRPGRPKRIVWFCWGVYWEYPAEDPLKLFNSHLQQSFNQISEVVVNMESEWAKFSDAIAEMAARSYGSKVAWRLFGFKGSNVVTVLAVESWTSSIPLRGSCRGLPITT